ncbi:hypothetical protein F5141DRAFT_1066986 [Pisolithus sp. B1]|nr:hypothetical protein F5141DRAFT_1066986 [Pisolithus sp. B1]
MSASKRTSMTMPLFVTPDATRDLIPGMWGSNMKKLEALMKEIPGESADKEAVCEWLDQYKKLSECIEKLQKFTADMSTHVPDYNNDMQTSIGEAFERLMVLQARFLQCMPKPKVKPVTTSSSGPQAGGEVVRQSQWQLEKTTDRGRGNEGGPPPKHVKVAVLSNMGSMTADEDLVEPEPTPSGVDPHEWCIKRGITCVWKEWTTCEPCHNSKKKCDKAGKWGRKHKNPEGPPPDGPTTPTPGPPAPLPPHTKDRPANNMVVCSRGSSEFLSVRVGSDWNKGPSEVGSGDGEDMSKVKINLTEPKEVLTPKETGGDPRKGKHKVQHGHMHPIEELDARITGVEQPVEWGEDALLNLYMQWARSPVNSLQQSKHQLWALKAW